MVMNRKPSGRAVSTGMGLVYGAIGSMICTILGAAIVGNLLSRETIPESAIGYAGIVILLLASFLGAMISGNAVKRRRLLVSMAAGGVYFLMLLSMTALFFGGQYSGVWVTALLVAGGSGAAALMGTRGREGKRHAGYKIKHG